ncbi:TonB family protein [Gilvimarinus sp. SDUM040013]|uniref:TonB family protein n=1 Tax=Gilvimarinus gilvus TaxID=3058038 RepID=A0ABU4S1A2_9GAMM|nr:TonB family protein [Gilvimarinus sp. SDUM040013]MDO3385360.1 TonB family protein [Gilvimarinus sp. SDUM040013]MDX6850935.1 TonB family protein [Gilvimarinus sp. SDUM040013]
MIRYFLAIALCFYCTFSAAQSTSAPNGIAPYVELEREAFLMALYVPGGASTAQAALASSGARALEIKFTADKMTAGKLSRLFLQSIAINAHPDVQRTSADSLATFFNSLKGSLRTTDVLTISEKTDASGVYIYLNGQSLANINDANFFNLVLVAWVGAVPPNTEFKAALLGDYRPEDLGRYQSITPTEERRAAIAAWVAPAPSPVVAEVESEKKQSVEKTVVAGAVASEAESAQAQGAVASVAESATESVDSAEATPLESTSTGELPSNAKPEDSAEQRADLALPATTPPAAATGLAEPHAIDVPVQIEQEREEDLPNFSAESLTVLQDYTAQLVLLTHQKIEYPRRAMKLRQTGSVRMGVVINREGEVVDIQPLLESGFKQLDRAVEKAIKSAEPYPALPDAITAERFEFVFPITFMLES